MRPDRRRRVADRSVPVLLALLLAAGCGEVKVERRAKAGAGETASGKEARERHLDGIHRLTGSGTNRQASFSADATRIVWLCRPESGAPFGIRTMAADGSDPRTIATGDGRCHGPVFTPDGTGIVYAAAAPGGPATPPAAVDGSPTGLWLFDDALDIRRVEVTGGAPRSLITSPGYDAEPSISWGGSRLAWSTLRAGRGAIMIAGTDGTDQRTLLATPGYAGGPQISPDGSRIVYHAVPEGNEKTLEIYLADLSGDNARRLTALEGVSFAPTWLPSQEAIVFCSNAQDRDFELFLIRPAGSGLERVTFTPGFDGFPAFSRDGRQLLWTSQRGTVTAGETQICKANWRN